MSGRLVSVNIGEPAIVVWRGSEIRTAFFKRPVSGAVRVAPLGLVGDHQADLEVHGGVRKSVYAYPVEHYPFWRSELPGVDLPMGSFGENLTVEGLSEGTLRPGDRLAVGSAVLEVTQPRLPCRKLNARFQREDMMIRFGRSLRTGFYLSVAQEGTLAAGDEIRVLDGSADQPTVEEIARERLRAVRSPE